MSRPAARLAWYRFRTTFHRRWSDYFALVVLIGLMGGLAMGSVAAGRRTESSFSVYWSSINPPDLIGATGVLNPQVGSDTGYDPAIVHAIAHLPHVRRVESQSGIDFLPLQRDGAPLDAPDFYTPAAGNGYGSVNGLFFDMGRVSVTKGRMADPSHADELMLSAPGAAALGVHVGSVLPVGIYTNAQTELPGFGTARVKPYLVVDEKVVGIAVFPGTVIEDAADADSAPNNLFTPALTRRLLSCCVNYTESGIEVEGGAGNLSKVAAEVAHVLPKGFPPMAETGPDARGKAQRALKPEGLALGVFGGIVGLAVLLIAGQLLGRQFRRTAEERQVMRALGAGPVMTAADGLLGVGAAVILGALLAAAVAVGLSPLAPLGPVAPIYPYRGVSFDWTVLGLGVLGLAVALSAIALVIGYRDAEPGSGRRARWKPGGTSPLVTAAGRAGLPAPGVMGLRFALKAGVGRESVPVRSAILGAMTAVMVIVASVTFGSSLNSLVSHPSLYGWNWDYALIAGADIPARQVTTLLDGDRYVSQWAGIYTASLNIDGESVPVIGESPNATVQPPVLSGHGLESADQVVLGALTLAELHKRVGDTVTESGGLRLPVKLRIVGTAAMPTLGSTGGAHLEIGTGALLSYRLLSAVQRNPFNSVPGPNAVLVRLRGGLPRGAGVAVTAADRRRHLEQGQFWRRGVRSAASGRDRQLPVARRHAALPGGRDSGSAPSRRSR